MRQLIIHLKNDHGSEFAITVPLPFNDHARRRVVAQIEPLIIGKVVNKANVNAFTEAIDYLPETDSQLTAADALYREGFDWHTACRKARETKEA